MIPGARAHARYPRVAHPLKAGTIGGAAILRAQAQRQGRDRRRLVLNYLGRVRRS